MFEDLFGDILEDKPQTPGTVEKNWEDADAFDTGLTPTVDEQPWTTGTRPDVWRT